MSNIETLVYVGQNTKIQIGGLLFAGILIASLGAVMDVAMSVSSAICEIDAKTGNLTWTELFKSGLHVGRDMMGNNVQYVDTGICRRFVKHTGYRLCLQPAADPADKFL